MLYTSSLSAISPWTVLGRMLPVLQYMSLGHDIIHRQPQSGILDLNHFKSAFSILIFIHYKPRIAVVILDL